MNKLRERIKQIVGISLIDSLYKSLTFHDFCIAGFAACLRCRVARVRKKQAKKIEQLRQQDKCRVVFFLQSPSVWKYDLLYHRLEKSDCFEPLVVVSPYNVHLIYDQQECFRVMKQAEAFAKDMGYNFVSAYNWEEHKWVDVKREYNPDIVFFTKPYKDTLPQYHIYNFPEALTLYVPYGINCLNNFHNNYGLPFQSLLWRLLVDTEFQKQYAQQYEKTHGDNVEVTGTLVLENMMNPQYVPVDVWKPQSKRKKRIIWAPHHTVDYLFNISNFLSYCDDMLQLADKYQDKIQIAFKPHPILKFKLINIWGKEKTEAYYQKWADLSNGQIEQGDYIDLFLNSDAMIHDCGSFIAEYLFTQKPVLFQIKDDKLMEQWNSFGQMCLEQHYHAYSIEETEKFICEVVIEGKDPKKEQREKFYKDYLYPKDGIMPSEKIFNILKNALGV